jgi:argininosuccinate lyase
MNDAKSVRRQHRRADGATRAHAAGWDKILDALVISPERALEELNSDWTASQEVADVLMRQYRLPFRVGHHFASEIVDLRQGHDIRPTDFPMPRPSGSTSRRCGR